MELNELNGEIFCNRKVNDIKQFSMEKKSGRQTDFNLCLRDNSDERSERDDE